VIAGAGDAQLLLHLTVVQRIGRLL
jgi:hypothetical protein